MSNFEANLREGKLSEIFPMLADLPKITVNLSIETGWGGLGMPFKSLLKLQHTATQFEGEGFYEVGPYRRTSKLTSTNKLVIPLDKTHTFLETLSQLPVKKGRYRPAFYHTDDFPYTSFTMQLTSGETLKIFSDSQNNTSDDKEGSGYAPWCVKFAGQTFVANNAIAYQAFMQLLPSLPIREQIENLEKKEERTKG